MVLRFMRSGYRSYLAKNSYSAEMFDQIDAYASLTTSKTASNHLVNVADMNLSSSFFSEPRLVDDIQGKGLFRKLI